MRTGKTVTTSEGVSAEYTYVYENGLLMQMTRGSRILDFSYDANGTPVRLAYRSNASATPSYYYYGTNSRGDVVTLYNSNGTVSAVYNYDAYGKFMGVTTSAGLAIDIETSVANLNPLRYRGYVYDNETGLYYLQTRYYDPTTCRFVNGDGYCSTGQGIIGNNMFAYCNNNPIIRFDNSGRFWKEIGGFFSNAWNKTKEFINNNIGLGVIRSTDYEAFSFDTLLFGKEIGFSTEGVIAGDVSKPVSGYIELASKPLMLTEYKLGIQVNIGEGGFSYADSGMEKELTIAGANNSLELIAGVNKIGYTCYREADFQTRTAKSYTHSYIRTVPCGGVTALAIGAYSYVSNRIACVVALCIV